MLLSASTGQLCSIIYYAITVVYSTKPLQFEKLCYPFLPSELEKNSIISQKSQLNQWLMKNSSIQNAFRKNCTFRVEKMLHWKSKYVH